MAYDISISEDKTYVSVRLRANVTKDIAIGFTKEAASRGKTAGLKKIFIDLRGVKSESGVLEKYEFAYEVGIHLGLTPEWKVCMLRDEERSEMQFIETVMRNAGFDYRMFTDEDEAFTWLAAE